MVVSRTPNMTDYEAECRGFQLNVPEYFNFAIDVIGKWASDPNKLAMLWIGQNGEERQLSFAHFAERSSRAANAFAALGIRKGDRVLVMLPRIPEWWESVLGLMKIGAIPIPCTTLLTPKDIQYRAEVSEAVVFITDNEGSFKYDQVRKECPTIRFPILVDEHNADLTGREWWTDYHRVIEEASPAFTGPKTRSDDPCLVYFTSGTVGYPKMVLHTHASYPIGHTITAKYWLDLHEDDLHWNLSEMGWAKAAWSNLFGPWVMGAAMFIQDARGKFNAIETLEMLHKYPITTLCAPPTAYRMLVLDEPLAYLKAHPPKALRHCVGAGEPLNPEVIKTWQQNTGMIIRDGYGQTETVLLCANFPPLEVKPGSMGKPSPGFEVSVIDHDASELPPNKEGDIAVKIKPHRPIWMFKEYWRNPEATQACIRGDWYITGDRAYKDEDGYYYLVGRMDDMTKSGAEKVYPSEVEEAIYLHPKVAEVAVLGVPDVDWGESILAIVAPKPGVELTEEELISYCKSKLAHYKCPKKVVVVKGLPHAGSGKIDRTLIRKTYG